LLEIPTAAIDSRPQAEADRAELIFRWIALASYILTMRMPGKSEGIRRTERRADFFEGSRLGARLKFRHEQEASQALFEDQTRRPVQNTRHSSIAERIGIGM